MNTKSFATFASLGLLAASCAYVAPAMADDLSGDLSPSMTADTAQPGQGTMGPATAPASADPTANAAAGMNQPNTNVGALSSSNADLNTPNNTDATQPSTPDTNTLTPEQGSPDTATGDDDY